MDPISERDRFVIVQKLLAARLKYHVLDEYTGSPLLYFEQEGFVQFRPSFSIYRDETKRQKVLSMRQDKFLQLAPTYTVTDSDGRPIGRLVKKFWAFPKSMWYVYNGAGQEVARAETDTRSILLSLLIRHGKELANFHILINGQKIGGVIRQWAVQDRYILDLTGDRTHLLDRHLAVCVGVALDVGEGR